MGKEPVSSSSSSSIEDIWNDAWSIVPDGFGEGADALSEDDDEEEDD